MILIILNQLFLILHQIPVCSSEEPESENNPYMPPIIALIICIILVLALDLVLVYCFYYGKQNKKRSPEPKSVVVASNPRPNNGQPAEMPPKSKMNPLSKLFENKFDNQNSDRSRQGSTGSLQARHSQPIIGIKPRVFMPGKDKNLDPIAYGMGEDQLRDNEFSDPCQRMTYNVVEKLKDPLEGETKPLTGMPACGCKLTNYQATSATTDMSPVEFCNFMKTKLNDILIEYTKLTNPPDSAILKKNIMKLGKKDRYFDIPVISQTAVHIMEGKKKCYIHANRVDGFGHLQQFICCQAPLQNSTNDFWAMFWQSKSIIIVQLARFKEMNADKCFMYWPDGIGMATMYGDIEVTNNGFFHKEESFVITELFVKKGNDSRIAYHCFYLRWPDRSVPKDPGTVLKFIDFIRTLKSDVLALGVTEGCKLGPPDIVHCSAGVGRTGTYCAIYISIDRLQQLGMINIQTVVNIIRDQRHSSVQEKTQYMFIYVAMLYYIIENNYVNRNDLI